MTETTGVSRGKHSSGIEIAYVDKGVGNPIGIPRDQYEANGYKPSFDSLPEK